MQHPVLMRYTRQLQDDVGIPPESRAVKTGEVHKVLSDHAAWLEERGFAERVQPAAVDVEAIEDPILQGFVRQMETGMMPKHANKMMPPAKKKRGRPAGAKNKSK